jgi:hypothetical protein
LYTPDKPVVSFPENGGIDICIFCTGLTIDDIEIQYRSEVIPVAFQMHHFKFTPDDMRGQCRDRQKKGK